MAYSEYNLNGMKLLNLDDVGMVDYDKYYFLLAESLKKRKTITEKYCNIQNNDKLYEEPDINYSNLYFDFLEKLKVENVKMYNCKLKFFNEYIQKLNEEEENFNEEKEKLISEGFLFDKELKKYGYYIFKVDNNYYQYKFGKTNEFKITAITNEDLNQIKMKVYNKKRDNFYSNYFQKMMHFYIITEQKIKFSFQNNPNEEFVKLNNELNKIRFSIYKIVKLRYEDIGKPKSNSIMIFNKLPNELKDELFILLEEYRNKSQKIFEKNISYICDEQINDAMNQELFEENVVKKNR